MTGQRVLTSLLGSARLSTDFHAADGDPDRAGDLYLWATELAGALHAQLSFVELAVRNAIDPQLSAWNHAQGFARAWTDVGGAAPLLYEVLGKSISGARRSAMKEAARRHALHRRHGSGTTHDDVVAQLMFGAWVKLLRPLSASESSHRQEELWDQVLHRAFPGADVSQRGRKKLGKQLEALRLLRNRVAHHDNLLEVDVRARFNGILSLLSTIDPDYPALVTARSSLRRPARNDPRREWTVGV